LTTVASGVEAVVHLPMEIRWSSMSARSTTSRRSTCDIF
jgi:hypothetical protein